MMEIRSSSQPPLAGTSRFFPTVKSMGPDKRECCADAWLRMVSDSPPGHPGSCLVAGAQCPFTLARPMANQSSSSNGGSPAGIISAKTVILTVIAISLIVVNKFRRNAKGGGGGGGGRGGSAAAPSTGGGEPSPEAAHEAMPVQDGPAIAWEATFASLVAGSD